MRRRSIMGPLILILIGGLFLAYNLRPDLRILDLLTLYWPFLLIFWGGVRLIEVLIARSRSERIRSTLSGGEIALIVVLCVLGSAFYSAHRHGLHINTRGLEVFGEEYSYDVSAQKPAGKVKRILIQNRRGNIRLNGSDQPELRVSGRKAVRAFHESEAQKAHERSALELVEQGDEIIIRTNQDRVSRNSRIWEDLEITAPRPVEVTVEGDQGEYEITDFTGGVTVNSERADVRLSRIGGNVRIQANRSDVVRAVEVSGNIDLEGRGSDVVLENIAGQVSIHGTYVGSLEFRKLAKPLHFESQNTDLRVESLPGEITMNLGDFAARQLVGPVRLITKSRDVRIEDFTQSLELEAERGDIELQPSRVPLAKITVRSKAGRIELALPSQAGFQLEAVAQHGEAENEFGPGIEKQTDGRTNSLKGKVGQGPTILLITDRGSVTVRKQGGNSRAGETKL